MATAIVHGDIKFQLGIPDATTTYDTELDSIGDCVEAAVDAYVTAAFLTASPAFVKEAGIMIAAGQAGLGLLNRPGYAEAVSSGGLAVSALDRSGYMEMVREGWRLLEPHSALADARATAETARITAETAKLTAEELRVDAEELRTDAETARFTAEELLIDKQALTEAEKPDKVIADAALSTALATDATERASVATARAARLVAINSSIAGTDDLPMESHADAVDPPSFSLDSTEYDS